MKTTKIYFDCEFTGLHKHTTLISIGIVSDCGKTFYAELTDFDKSQVDDWILKNVIQKLTLVHDLKNHYWTNRNQNERTCCGDKSFVRHELIAWLDQFEKIEIYSDCLAYDWMLFVDLLCGHALELPEKIYYIPFDLCTSFKENKIDPDISREEFISGEKYTGTQKHNALHDAQVIKSCFEWLEQTKEHRLAMDQIQLQEKEDMGWNEAVITIYGINLEEVLDGCSLLGRIELVPQEELAGKAQYEEIPNFENTVYCDQFIDGLEGDSGHGYIFIQHSATKQWIKIPYTF